MLVGKWLPCFQVGKHPDEYADPYTYDYWNVRPSIKDKALTNYLL
jgi:hypothetical protein